MLMACHAILAWQKCRVQDFSVLYLQHNQKGTMDISLLLQ